MAGWRGEEAGEGRENEEKIGRRKAREGEGRG